MLVFYGTSPHNPLGLSDENRLGTPGTHRGSLDDLRGHVRRQSGVLRVVRKGAFVKGTFQKTTQSHDLACQTCASFRDDDPDIFYCELQQSEFPALCEQYRQSERIAPLRNEWSVPDEL